LVNNNINQDHYFGYLDNVDGVKNKEDKYKIEGVMYDDKVNHI
jgi:hypothetical protein